MKLAKAAAAFATLIRTVISDSDGLRVQENWEEMTPRLESGGPVPFPWFMWHICLGFTGKDIGPVGIPGCTEALAEAHFHLNSDMNVLYSGPYELEGSGAGIGGHQDQFHFFQGPLPLWNTDNSVEVINLSEVGHQVGAMVRGSLDEGSKHFSLFVKGDGTLIQATRFKDNGSTLFHTESSSSTSIGALANVKVWLRVEKKLKKFKLFRDSEYEFRSYYKINESDNWIEVGQPKTLKKRAEQNFEGGVAVTSNGNTKLAVVNIPRVELISFGKTESLSSSTFELESCAPSARKLKLKLSSPVDHIEVYEFHATFAGLDAGEPFGLNAIKRYLAESSGLNDMPMGLVLDLGKSYLIDSVSIVGRKCGGGDSNGPGCLCQLSGATLSLVDDYGEDITSIDIGDEVCGKSMLKYTLDASPEFCASSRLMHTTGDSLVVRQSTVL